jgi:nucleotide-binding universal stress UspA family protein
VTLIVVGVDGSQPAAEALRYALRLAKLERSKLWVVTAWHVPAVSFGSVGAAPLLDLRETFEMDAMAISAQALEAVAAEAAGQEIEAIVKEGHPAKVLLDAAKDASTLVVGSRGLGGFAELLLGSVSHECAKRANCPVVIVPSRDAR